MHAKLLQARPTFCSPMDCSLQGSCVHGIFQARIPEWVVVPPPGDLLGPRIKPTSLMSPAWAGGLFTTSTTWEALDIIYSNVKHTYPFTQQFHFWKFNCTGVWRPVCKNVCHSTCGRDGEASTKDSCLSLHCIALSLEGGGPAKDYISQHPLWWGPVGGSNSVTSSPRCLQSRCVLFIFFYIYKLNAQNSEALGSLKGRRGWRPLIIRETMPLDYCEQDTHASLGVCLL